MYIQAPPKPIPRTLETTREPDETIVFPDDEEILQDEMTDEMAPYFKQTHNTKDTDYWIQKGPPGMGD